jgi:hypothetical protein
LNADLNRLLDSLVGGTITEAERADLLKNLADLESNPTRPVADRMAAIVLRASLEARSLRYG